MRIGIDLGGTSVKAALCADDGAILIKQSVPTKTGDPDGLRADMKQLALALCVSGGVQPDEVESIGIGVPGSYDKPSCTLRFGTNLGMNDVCFAETFQPEFGCAVQLDNDANCAALGEATAGAGKNVKNMLMITLGTGVGGGIILNEKIWTGEQGVGGEIGHIHVMEGEKEACNCGGHGCLEQVASATGIARTARRMLAADNRPSTLRSLKNISAKNVLDAAKAGDALALESLNKSCYYLGWALATISMVLDPQAFLIGGGVSKAGTFLTDIIKRYHDELSPMATKKADIVLAKLGNDAGIYGAAKLIIG